MIYRKHSNYNILLIWINKTFRFIVSFIDKIFATLKFTIGFQSIYKILFFFISFYLFFLFFKFKSTIKSILGEKLV